MTVTGDVIVCEALKGRDQVNVEKCFACGKSLGKKPHLVDTRDAQTVYVGSECYKLIVLAEDKGYKPPQGGPRLYAMRKD